MFKMPPQGSKAREALGEDPDYIAEVLNPANANRLPTTMSARAEAKRYLAATPSTKALAMIILRANDERWLVLFGKRGGMTKLWNFGDGTP